MSKLSRAHRQACGVMSMVIGEENVVVRLCCPWLRACLRHVAELGSIVGHVKKITCPSPSEGIWYVQV